MEQELKKIESGAREALEKTGTVDDLENLRIEYLGRKGVLTAILRALGDLNPEERKNMGERANQLRKELDELFAKKRHELEATNRESILQKEWLDVTRPGAQPLRGHLHPITKILRDVMEIFARLGFETIEGPEIETEYYNFDALNIPATHPARDLWDTFWLQNNQNEIRNPKSEIRNKSQIQNSKSQKLLLRTHTSPVQIRYMETHNPPIRIIVPGRVYRYEATDASHDIQFYQLEGLMADTTVSIANFKAIMQEFFSKFFKTNTEIRLRPSYFPFTEPSFEVDISCMMCRQKGCSVCKKTGWLELAGAGMVHPKIFKNVGYEPKNVQGFAPYINFDNSVLAAKGGSRSCITGFAFGMGLTRLAMMKYKIPDARLFNAGDLRFLKQF